MRLCYAALMVPLLVGCFNLDRTWDGGTGDERLIDPLDQGADRGGEDGPRQDLPRDDLSGTDLGPADLAPPDQPGPLLPFVLVTAGGFTMGSPSNEPCREPGSTNGTEQQHQVLLTHDFYIKTTEVTQAEYLAIVGKSPSTHGGCPDCPVEQVSWNEAAHYCNLLSQKDGFTPCYNCKVNPAITDCSPASAYSGKGIYNCPGYRLPTDAEWEYAYRAGTTTALYNGPLAACTASDPNADAIGWYKHNAGQTTHPAAGKAPNAWGIHDMAGNVTEWCHDPWEPDLGSDPETDPMPQSGSNARVVRGGSHASEPQRLRAADRGLINRSDSFGTLGFRWVRRKP